MKRLKGVLIIIGVFLILAFLQNLVFTKQDIRLHNNIITSNTYKGKKVGKATFENYTMEYLGNIRVGDIDTITLNISDNGINPIKALKEKNFILQNNNKDISNANYKIKVNSDNGYYQKGKEYSVKIKAKVDNAKPIVILISLKNQTKS